MLNMLFGSKPKRKKTYKYCVKVKGVKISCHYTKSAAMKKAKNIPYSKVTPYGMASKKSYSKKSTRRKYSKKY